MINNIKNHLLTYLVADWLNKETDVNNIVSLKNTLQEQQDKLTGYKPVIGFTLKRDKDGN
tara:strand:+ start:15 stop:194 length:180 start_codon:yes stop_codon:yes gene_type:complete